MRAMQPPWSSISLTVPKEIRSGSKLEVKLDLGALYAQGLGRAQDLVEAYKWMWLATREDVPGADAVLREISQKLNMPQVLEGVQRAAKYQDGHKSAAKTSSVGGR